MKELKYNIKYLLKKKELYFMIIFLLLVVIANVVLVSAETLSRIDDYKETIETAEYLQIFSNFSSWLLCPICILCIPIISSLVFCDISWLEKKGKIDYLLCNRLNYKKNIMIRLHLRTSSSTVSILCTMIQTFIHNQLITVRRSSCQIITPFILFVTIMAFHPDKRNLMRLFCLDKPLP